MAFDDCMLGAGVAREVLEAQLRGMPVLKIGAVSGNLIGLMSLFAGVLTIGQSVSRHDHR